MEENLVPPGLGDSKHVDRVQFSRGRWFRYFAALTVLLLIVLAVFVVPAILNSYDRVHREWISCTVADAVAGNGSNVSRTGIGGSQAEIEISTKECGSLLLRQGVTESNSRRLVETLKQSKRFQIEVGSGYYSIRKALALMNRLPSAYRFREE